MAKASSNIVHLYFRKENEEGKTLLKINPIHLTGIEIVIPADGEPESHDIEVPASFETGLLEEGYQTCNPFEFNLYGAGLL
jgi:hypothetical protein